MKLVMLSPQGLPDDLADPTGEAEGQPEYVMTFPVPGPEAEGAFVFLTLTPDGRPTVVLVDSTTVDDRTVRGYLGEDHVITIPKEAPWMLLRRELMQYQTKAEARRFAAEAYRHMLGGQHACPVHGAEAAPASPEDKPAGQYL